MGDAFGTWFMAHYPTIFWIALTAIVTFFVAWRLFKYHARIRVIETEVSKMPSLEKSIALLTSLSEKIEIKIDDNVLPKLDRALSGLEVSNNAINKLVFYLSANNTAMDSQLFVINSPLQLSELGMKILEITGGKEFIDNNIEVLIKELKSNNYKSALDIEKNSGFIIFKHAETDAFTKIKNYVYNNPIFKAEGVEIGLSISLISNAMGIYLRNKFLEKYPEFNK